MRGTVKKDAARGSWYFVIDVGPDAATGKRRRLRRRGFETRKSAEAALNSVLSELRDGEYVEPSSQPVRIYLEHWLAAVAVDRKPRPRRCTHTRCGDTSSRESARCPCAGSTRQRSTRSTPSSGRAAAAPRRMANRVRSRSQPSRRCTAFFTEPSETRYADASFDRIPPPMPPCLDRTRHAR